METFDHLWTVREVAAYLRVSTATIYNLVSRGKLPAVRFGASIRFDADAIRRLVENQTVSGKRG